MGNIQALTIFFYSPVTLNEDYWGFAGGADGTAEHPYIITSTEGLDMLSEQVKGGDGYQGEYFELSDDITYTYSGTNPDNYTAIGYYSTYYYSQPFKGHFDGKGHTVSGLQQMHSARAGKSVAAMSCLRCFSILSILYLKT